MKIEIEELTNLLQGKWQLENAQHKFEVVGTDITVLDKKPVKTSLSLIRNLQLKNWQINMSNHAPWGERTYIVEINDESFVLYDFEPKVAMRIGLGSKLLNPARIYRYNRLS
jgi:predicted HTH transcriptional regulator